MGGAEERLCKQQCERADVCEAPKIKANSSVRRQKKRKQGVSGKGSGVETPPTLLMMTADFKECVCPCGSL